MDHTRRGFLLGAAATALTASATGAHAQDIIREIIEAKRTRGWNDQFDAAASRAPEVQSTMPIFSPETANYVEQAIWDYQAIVQRGGWPVVPAAQNLRIGVVDDAVTSLRRRLMISGDLSEQAGMSPAFDTYVDAAVKRFQARHGLPADGVIGDFTFKTMNVSAPIRLGQLETNLVRLRSMSGFLGDRYVMVNIPAAQIEAVENGRVVQRHTAIVGKVERQTPILNSKINQVIVNPYWHAPESIVRKDIVPLMRKNPNYLAENSIRILGPDQQEIDPRTIDWNAPDAPDRAAQFLFRQDPGKINAMASVKINFPNEHAVYMHDTPQQGLFNQLLRFESSGCVRVQNVRDLVTWLLRDNPDWNRRRLEAQIKTGESQPVQLNNPVPVYFTYVSAWSTANGVVHFRDDIYGRDGVDELQLSSAF